MPNLAVAPVSSLILRAETMLGWSWRTVAVLGPARQYVCAGSVRSRH